MDAKTVAINAAKKAGDILLELSKSEIKYQEKGKHDILAQADLKCEEAIIKEIRGSFPDHSILSEECGEEKKDSEFLWVIDPVDGTINFASGLDEYCVSIALLKDEEIILGVIYLPSLDKLYLAQKDMGATLNGKQLSVSKESDALKMLVAADMSSKESYRKEIFEIMKKISPYVRHIRILGSSAVHLAYLSQGRFDFYFMNKLNFWDYAAGILIVKEAGGIVTDFKGDKITRSSKNIIASNNKNHKNILKIIND